MESVILTYNVELKMSQEQYAYWELLLSQVKEAYNDCALYIRNKKLPLNIKIVHDNVYDLLRNKYTLIPAQGIVKIYKDVLSAFRSIKKNKHKKFKTPRRKNLALRFDKRLYSNLSINGINISCGTKNKRERIEFKLYHKITEMFLQYKTKDPLIFIRDKRIFLSIPFEIQQTEIKTNDSIGVDLGIKRLYVDSNGNAFKDKIYLKNRRKIRYLKRKLREKGTKSANRHLKKLSKRERHLSNDVCQRASNELIKTTKESIIVMENLSKIKQKTSKFKNGFKRRKHNNMLSQVPFKKFLIILTYKALLSYKRVETVSPSYTSQTDSRTDKRDGKRQGCRYYCSDGKVLDSDWNASVNIAKKAKHPLSNKIPVDGGLMFHNGRRLVNPSIVDKR